MRQKGPPCHGWNNFQRWNLCFQWGFSNSIWGIFINTRRCRGDTGLALRLSEHSEDTWRADKLSLNIFILLNICGGGGTLWRGQTQQHGAGGRPGTSVATATQQTCTAHCSPHHGWMVLGRLVPNFARAFLTTHFLLYLIKLIGRYNLAALHVDMCPGWWLGAGGAVAGLVLLCCTPHHPATLARGHCCPHHCSDAVQTLQL